MRGGHACAAEESEARYGRDGSNERSTGGGSEALNRARAMAGERAPNTSPRTTRRQNHALSAQNSLRSTASSISEDGEYNVAQLGPPGSLFSHSNVKPRFHGPMKVKLSSRLSTWKELYGRLDGNDLCLFPNKRERAVIRCDACLLRVPAICHDLFLV